MSEPKHTGKHSRSKHEPDDEQDLPNSLHENEHLNNVNTASHDNAPVVSRHPAENVTPTTSLTTTMPSPAQETFPNTLRIIQSTILKPKVFVSRQDIPEGALSILRECELDIWEEEIPVPRDEFLERINGVHALFINPLDRVDIEALNAAGVNLKVIATMSAGFDHIDVQEAKNRGIKVGCTYDVLSDAVAELAIGLLLDLSRRIRDGYNAVCKGKWRRWTPWTWMNGIGLKNSIVGIVGLGRIGTEVGKRLVSFKPSKILYTSREPKSSAAEINAQRVDLDVLLEESDFVILCCSLNSSTRNLINSRKFDLMKKDSFLINVSRGEVIDQDALIKVLKNKKIGGAALDVTTPEPLPKKSPLLKLTNCIILPHMGSAETRTRILMAEVTAQNVLAGLKGNKLPYEL